VDARHRAPPRHWRVWLVPAWRAALRVAPAPDLLAQVEAWLARGLPLVAARRDPCAPDAIALGLALPGKRRVALLVAPPAVARVAPPLALAEAIPSAPAAWRDALAALDAEARAAGVPLSVYGSLAWQRLSGAPYVGPASDVDLLAPALDPAQRDAALAVLGRHAADRAPALDGELLLPGGRAVAWREARSGAARLLVKSANAVALEPAAAVLGPPLDPDAVDRAAIGALLDELALHPKPGLAGRAAADAPAPRAGGAG
jgi:phosphoribosyl-dephospho-CoA transferase